MNYVVTASRESTVNIPDTSPQVQRTDVERVSVLIKNCGRREPLTFANDWLTALAEWDNQSYVGATTQWNYEAVVESASDEYTGQTYDDSKGDVMVSINMHSPSDECPRVVKFVLEGVNKNTVALDIRSRVQSLLGGYYLNYACELSSVSVLLKGAES